MKIVKLSNMIMLRVDKSQYIKNCNTEKAYAIKYTRTANDMLFLSKKYTKYKFEESTNIHWFTFPKWLHEKMSDKSKSIVKYFEDEELDRICNEDVGNRFTSKGETCPIIRPY
tara:strand:+ start:451 stop:789 length:339 start_codon:yes stop_codon:yes gene_type:complete